MDDLVGPQLLEGQDQLGRVIFGAANTEGTVLDVRQQLAVLGQRQHKVQPLGVLERVREADEVPPAIVEHVQHLLLALDVFLFLLAAYVTLFQHFN